MKHPSTYVFARAQNKSIGCEVASHGSCARWVSRGYPTCSNHHLTCKKAMTYSDMYIYTWLGKPTPALYLSSTLLATTPREPKRSIGSQPSRAGNALMTLAQLRAHWWAGHTSRVREGKSSWIQSFEMVESANSNILSSSSSTSSQTQIFLSNSKPANFFPKTNHLFRATTPCCVLMTEGHHFHGNWKMRSQTLIQHDQQEGQQRQGQGQGQRKGQRERLRQW